MKRVIGVLLLCLMLCGCGAYESGDPVSFYYVRKTYAYYEEEPVMVGESRDIAGHRQDLEYLMSLYLMGPADEGMACPFPKRTQLLKLEAADDALTIELSDTARTLPDSAFSLACACISRTAMELSGAESVTVVSGTRSLVTRQDSLMLTDVYIR